MGHINAPMVLGTLGAVEMGLKALGIPHGRRRAGGAMHTWRRRPRLKGDHAPGGHRRGPSLRV